MPIYAKLDVEARVVTISHQGDETDANDWRVQVPADVYDDLTFGILTRRLQIPDLEKVAKNYPNRWSSHDGTYDEDEPAYASEAQEMPGEPSLDYSDDFDDDEDLALVAGYESKEIAD